jgi:hypothetical protein
MWGLLLPFALNGEGSSWSIHLWTGNFLGLTNFSSGLSWTVTVIYRVWSDYCAILYVYHVECEVDYCFLLHVFIS